MKKSDLVRDYKRKPKEVIEDYVPNAVFVKSKHENKPEQIIIENWIRQGLLQLDWHFQDDMKDYPAPNILLTF